MVKLRGLWLLNVCGDLCMAVARSQRFLDKATRFAHSHLMPKRGQNEIVLRIPAHWALVMIDTAMQHKLYHLQSGDSKRYQRSGHRLEENGRTLVLSYCRREHGTRLVRRRLDVGLLADTKKGLDAYYGRPNPGPQWEEYTATYEDVDELEVRLTTLSKSRTGFAGSYRRNGTLIKDVWPWPLNGIITKYGNRAEGGNG
jgi:hypothetical protein